MTRLLADCEAVIFIAYTVPEDAEVRGYSDWLVKVDNPFFNAIPGVLHYANWRVEQVTQGTVPPWGYFDFHGIATHEDLERVWFNPDLDAFRAEWLQLWGYGRGDTPAVLRHAYLMRPVMRRQGLVPGPDIKLRGGVGPVPVGLDADLVFKVDGVLKKHFAGKGPRPSDWLTPTQQGNPLGLDWIAVSYGAVTNDFSSTLALHSKLIAEPSNI